MIGPVFGHFKDSLTKEQHCIDVDGEFDPGEDSVEEALKELDLGVIKKVKYKDADREMPIGIVQLMNSTGRRVITEYDRLKF